MRNSDRSPRTHATGQELDSALSKTPPRFNATRRSAVKWTLPIVSVTAAAPLFAASSSQAAGCTSTTVRPDTQIRPVTANGDNLTAVDANGNPTDPVTSIQNYQNTVSGPSTVDGGPTSAGGRIIMNDGTGGAIKVASHSDAAPTVTLSIVITTLQYAIPAGAQLSVGSFTWSDNTGQTVSVAAPVSLVNVSGAAGSSSFSSTQATVSFSSGIPANSTVTINVSLDLSSFIAAGWPTNKYSDGSVGYKHLDLDFLMKFTYPAQSTNTAAGLRDNSNIPLDSLFAGTAEAQLSYNAPCV